MQQCRVVVSLCCAAVITAAPAVAQEAIRVGSGFQVNAYSAGEQYASSTLIDAGGNFKVLWEGNGNGGTVWGRGFDAAGSSIGNEFQIDAYTTTWDHGIFFVWSAPAIGADASGKFVVTWQNDAMQQPGSYLDVFAQRLDSTGARIGQEFQVNTYTTQSQLNPSIAVASDGAFVVVWSGFDGAAADIFGQRFDSSGTRLGSEFRVNTYTTGAQFRPKIAETESGNFVVAWAQTDGAPYGQVIFAQRLDPSAAPLGAEFQVNTSTGFGDQPSIGHDAMGNFIVVWQGLEASGNTGIFGQRFDANGARVGGEFQINTYTTGRQDQPSVSATATGEFVVVWRTELGAYDYRVLGQQFARDGTPAGSEFQVDTPHHFDPDLPSVAVNDRGAFVVSWHAYGPHVRDVFAQRFQFPLFDVDRHALRFGAVKSGTTLTQVTPAQTVSLTAPDPWTASSDQPFVSVSPASGSGTSTLTIQVSSVTGLPASGAAPTATITITSPPALAKTITVNVQVYAAGTTAPVGSFDTPVNNTAGVTGAIPVTGWALDDVGVSAVQLWRDPVSADPPGAIAANNKVFIGDATFVAGVRPDVEATFPSVPLNYRAAWGYMLLTAMLPNTNTAAPAGGVGTFTLYAYVYDVEGNLTILPTRTFTCDNTTATKPFGTIDTPAQGETVSGTINNFGWILTPQTATIPTDGSTIVLYVDGLPRGTATYNAPRSDIATLFPGYNNSSGPVGVFTIDTTTLTNGVHTIFWIVTDDQSRAEGIGSRYFYVLN